MLVKVLLWPVFLLGPAIGGMLPRGNIGTTEHPVYEGTPIDLPVGIALVGFSIILYPVAHVSGFIVGLKNSGSKRSTQE